PAEAANLRGAPILATLAGGAMVADGNHSPDPSVAGEVRAMRLALRDAGLDPAAIDLVSAHGTSSVLGDAVEAEAIQTVFKAHLHHLRVVATKGLAGHCLNAAAVVQ